ncbi:hypothetical protein LPJ78_003989 [Coemansia sp. RSA 989]|nr:hypothetical protein BX667DRAFT_507780 [Coemansia mojavensis]KAJ1749509.1 hypothetical protein LPJ79_003659 [Coemansia sp. RSA 1821]KAJ1863538.1 hypothetical protein LPJ78_003989 [Coemansia sp. RSA 989]KAJ1871417.1 hypothetical protein LPJ55_003896 [Coemansia sp. RSA 990]KAJ2668694.1 hypothetical protein IWW42_005026 [Coemansia sp. RSA 1085]
MSKLAKPADEADQSSTPASNPALGNPNPSQFKSDTHIAKTHTNLKVSVEDAIDSAQPMPPPPGHPAKPCSRSEQTPRDREYELTYGKREYPDFDPAIVGSCPLKFIRQFEHAAIHNGLQQRAWAKRLDACLHGRAEDWSFDECPLEMPHVSWEVRKKQFLDWALLPAEQEIRRQRLLRFYHSESDLSIDFVYTFEEAARGLRDYKEDVWVRKCIANLQPSIRSALFELWPDGLPVRFRDLRDSLYAVDWGLYEAASASLKVVKCGAPYIYDSCSQATIPSTSRSSTFAYAERPLHILPASVTSGNRRPSLMISTATNAQAGSCSPPAPSPALLPTRRRRTAVGLAPLNQSRNISASPVATASNSPAGSAGTPSKSSSEGIRTTSTTSSGLYELITSLTRISERERTIIMSALEKIISGDDDAVADSGNASMTVSPRPIKSQNRLATVASLTSRPSTAAATGVTGTRAETAVAMAATAQQFASMDISVRPATSFGPSPLVDHSVLNSRRASANRISNTSRTTADDNAGAAVDGILPARESVRMSTDSAGVNTEASKIKLRTRPMTSASYTRRLSSPLLDIHEDMISGEERSVGQLDVAAGMSALKAGESTSSKGSLQANQKGHSPVRNNGQAHRRKLSSRKSDSALTTATRSMQIPARENSEDHALRSPEFTILHPELSQRHQPHRRRERIANAFLRFLR